MPEGNRRTPVDITLSYYDCSENNVNGYHIYTFYVTGDNYLEIKARSARALTIVYM